MAKPLLQNGMYVRCPADQEYPNNPRVFVCGQIVEMSLENRTAMVKIHDPFQLVPIFEHLPCGTVEYPLGSITRCTLFTGSLVRYRDGTYKVRSVQQAESGYYDYYIQNERTHKIECASETELIASLTNGRIEPLVQLMRYEFQNPCWYFGHAIVSKNINILENSIYGFKELAGAKIYLLPHQMNSIMRCLQDSPCRYMLADEVGMGKTVEAISILKLFLLHRSDMRALILVPDQLMEQWKKELLIKFGIDPKTVVNGNHVTIQLMSRLTLADCTAHWDFVIIDEVHRYLENDQIYSRLHLLSMHTDNILLLSATPVQQRREEYLSLLRLLQPHKYDCCTESQFNTLIEKQGKIIQKTALLLDDLNDFSEEYNRALSEEEDPHESDDLADLFEEISDGLESICKELNNPKLTELQSKLDFDVEDCGIYQIKVMISFICESYQIENNIIRNRRRILENNDGKKLLPVRAFIPLSYSLNKDLNTDEALCYDMLVHWVSHEGAHFDIEKTIRLLLSAFFSSPWAFSARLREFANQGILDNDELEFTANKWLNAENYIVENITDILDDPDQYTSECNSRIFLILNYLYDELYDQKVVLFANEAETFAAYRTAINKAFPKDKISFFGSDMDLMDLEANAYRFQSEKNCRIMLCDYTGGEGRNFQCADYIIHIDLPWDASLLEQRIGRLDRLERDPERSVVTSIVPFARDSFEEALFDFFSKGLRIFEQSLSGMEIIMKDINQEIYAAVRDDLKYGLSERIPAIIERTKKMRDEIRKEQNYDAAGFIFKPMYAELRRLIEYYAKNENELFAQAMTDWGTLAGFHGYHAEDGTMTYHANSFSSKSAINSLLIPPRWAEYIGSSQNQFLSRVSSVAEHGDLPLKKDQSISGTFIRKQAIENDYLHFFAPGDAIFDCITTNAIQSCKGCSCAVLVPAKINWKGFVFTWSMVPNEAALFKHGVSVYAMSPYRSFMMTEQVVTVVSVDNVEDESETSVLREYNQILARGIRRKNYLHLGARGERNHALPGNLAAKSNQAWFKQAYPAEVWRELVKDAYKEARSKAANQFIRRSNVRGAKDEMERILSAATAKKQYYETGTIDLNSLKQEQAMILEAIKSPKIILDAVAFLWMVKTEDETTD